MDCIGRGDVASKSNMQQLTGIITLSPADMPQTWTLSLSCYWNTNSYLSIELHPPCIQIQNESCQPFPTGACRLTKTIGRPTVLCRCVWEWKQRENKEKQMNNFTQLASRYVRTALCKKNASLPRGVIHLPHANPHLWMRGHTYRIRVTYICSEIGRQGRWVGEGRQKKTRACNPCHLSEQKAWMPYVCK